MLQEPSRRDRFLDRLEAGHWVRRMLAVGGITALAGVTFATGLLLRPTPVALPATLVIGTPAAMTVNGVPVRDPAVINEVVRDLNNLHPDPDTGISVLSCPNAVGQQYVVGFIYSNGDHWTVIVGRDGCEVVSAGGFSPRTRAFSNPQLLKDLDAIDPKALSE
jgi:hypothetical protein